MTWKELRVGGLNEFQILFWFVEILLQSVLDLIWIETVLHSSQIGTKRWRHNPLKNFVIEWTSRNHWYFENFNYPKMSITWKCRLPENVDYSKISITRKYRLPENVVYPKMSFTRNWQLPNNVDYSKMTITRKCQLPENGDYPKRSSPRKKWSI